MHDTAVPKPWLLGPGCLNTDGETHGIWFQEKMGWATVTVAYNWYTVWDRV